MVGIPDWNGEEHIPDSDNKQVDKSMREKRIEICESCKNITGFKFCRECGCFLPIKTYFYYFDCPLDKWPKNE